VLIISQPVAPGHSSLFGHLLTLKSASEKLPPGAHYQYIFDDIYLENFQKEGIFYLDAWPMSGLFLAVISPNAAITATQPSQKLALNRPKLLPRFFKPITGGPNLFDMREPEWRPWRAAFIKGFNTEHFLSLIPSMVKETLVYRDTLRELARNGKKFDLDTITLRFTMDFMGQTIL
jgi:cytochrome P450